MLYPCHMLTLLCLDRKFYILISIQGNVILATLLHKVEQKNPFISRALKAVLASTDGQAHVSQKIHVSKRLWLVS